MAKRTTPAPAPARPRMAAKAAPAAAPERPRMNGRPAAPAPAAAPAARQRPRMAKPAATAPAPAVLAAPARVASFVDEPSWPEEVLRGMFDILVEETFQCCRDYRGIAAKCRDDWMTRIHCTYTFDMKDDDFDLETVRAIINEATLYFTGTTAFVDQIARRTVRVLADGYAAGPHGSAS